MRVVRYYRQTASDSCFRHAIVEDAKSKLRVCLMLDTGVTTKLVPKSEGQYMEEIEYSVKKAKRVFNHAAQRLGKTKGARQMLGRIR